MRSITLDELREFADPNNNIGRPPFDEHFMRRTRSGWAVVTREHHFGPTGIEWVCEPSRLRRYFKEAASADAELTRRVSGRPSGPPTS